MSLLDKLLGRKPKEPEYFESVFKLLNGYQPAFHTFHGGIYESELIRAAIHARATHISKLKVEVQGSGRPALQSKLRHGPNEFHTWSQFMYRLSTILDVNNTAFIIPVYDKYGELSGVYCPLPENVEAVEYKGTPYLRYSFSNGQKAAIEMEFCGVMTKFQYRSDLYGETNHALIPTLDLVKINDEAIKEGVQNAASYRFMAQLSNFAKAEDLVKERERFTTENFSSKARGGGMLLFPNTYSNIQQIEAKPWVIDADQRKAIQDNVNAYFGVNEDVLTNAAFGDAWSAFYEGAVEPFAIQFSEVMTRMLFTFREQSTGNRVMATANRLQYLSNKEKAEVAAIWADRGIATIDEIREIWNMAPLPDGIGDKIPIRGEFVNAATGQHFGDESTEVNKDE